MNAMNFAAAMYHVHVQVILTLVEAQTVIAYRCLGFAGLWPSDPSERRRMIAEKPPVFAASGFAAVNAMMAGRTPDAVAQAALAPLRRKTRSNAKRLSRAR